MYVADLPSPPAASSFTPSLKKEVVEDDVPLPLGRREGARILALFRIITWRCPSLVEETAARSMRRARRRFMRIKKTQNRFGKFVIKRDESFEVCVLIFYQSDTDKKICTWLVWYHTSGMVRHMYTQKYAH